MKYRAIYANDLAKARKSSSWSPEMAKTHDHVLRIRHQRSYAVGALGHHARDAAAQRLQLLVNHYPVHAARLVCKSRVTYGMKSSCSSAFFSSS